MNFFFHKANPKAKVVKIALDAGDVTVRLRYLATARRLTLRVNAAGDVVLTLPKGMKQAPALEFLERQRDWLAGRLNRRANEKIPFADGTDIPVQGRTITLISLPGLRGVNLFADKLQVGGDPAHFARRATDHLRKLARDTLSDRVRHFSRELGVTVKRVSVRDTTSRWGSCSTDGSLSFSWRLILAPPHVLDYVAAHEVAHRVEHNHSDRFWQTVTRLMPDYQTAEHWLKIHGPELHRYG